MSVLAQRIRDHLRCKDVNSTPTQILVGEAAAASTPTGVDGYKILLDLPPTKVEPALGFTEYANALKGIIEGSAPRFAVGIFGSWGSGKTTLMRAIEAQLDQKQTICVQFSAWRYEKEPHLIVRFSSAT
jgi:predicted KAP-like P-loop ATPase